ncbi:PH domain-containing protein [Pseudarthrobacter sp. J75]|uniref:PH domain-containing protein n=1 Tax=unclassified Pseudarthrobacter TaxID=2647000 RepID=UPI002E80493E|nr:MULTISPECIES: PH domain-containing protein [unclassified Pseudarthrobacter]MEE2521697.1 PH domain-containing protein [Pseudarthrobacter sp. J47]MEE2527774.1 PH domain-containing protein [Pseudarthrobacter sp. J75]MEE2569342.1 PH domain-containing protein [Pseudarthrobacter sp. J64]
MRKDLLPGEQVIVLTRPQPRALTAPAAVFVLTPALAAFASAWIIKGEAATLLPVVEGLEFWLVAACVVLGAWIWLGYCLPRLMRWSGTRYILTSRRAIARFGTVRRRDRQLSLAAVRNVLVSQSILQRMLRSGNISLESGYGGSLVFPDMPEVSRFRNFVLEAIDDLPEEEFREIERLNGPATQAEPRNGEKRWKR